MSKQLLTEYRIWNPKKCLLIEQTENGLEKIYLTGKIQEAEAKNQNERWYPKPILEREVDNFKQIIENNTTQALGELDHPDNTIVNLEKVSHIMRDIWWKGNEVWGKIEILGGPEGKGGTPNGRILESLVRRGLSVGISSRGIGSTLEEDGREVVQDDYQIITFDIVSNPSTKEAFLIKENYKKRSIPLSKEQERAIKFFKINNIINKILK